MTARSVALRYDALRAAAAVVRAGRRARRRRVALLTAGLALTAAVLAAVGVVSGDVPVAPGDLLRVLTGERVPGVAFIIVEVRLPRVVVGALVGAALALAGTVFQTTLRNPLASPDVVGISYGASAGAVAAIVLLGAGGRVVPVAALVGAVGVAAGIAALARGGRGGGVAGQRLVLVGIGVAAALQSLVTFLLTRTDVRTAQEALVWLSGSLNPATWERAGPLALGLGVLVPALAALARTLGGLRLGDDTAAGLGIRVDRARLGLLLVAVALTAVATAAAGPVAFVALLSGPIARRLLGGEASLAAAALVGAVVVLGAQAVATALLPGSRLPVGVVTGALGAPFLLWLLATANRRTA